MGASIVMGTSTNDGRRARLKEFGCDLALDTRDPKWPDKVKEATGGKGVDLIVDQVSASVANQNMEAAAMLGRIVNVGRLGGMKGEFNFDLHALKRIDYIGVTFRTRSPEEVRDIVKAAARRPVAGHRGRQALAADRQDLPAGQGRRGACAHEGQRRISARSSSSSDREAPRRHRHAKSINHLATADSLFFGKGGLDRGTTEKMVNDALAGCDDGELFLEYCPERELGVRRRQAEERRLRHHPGLRPARGRRRGDRLRPCLGARRGGDLKRAAATVKAVRAGHRGTMRRVAARHQPAALRRRQPARRPSRSTRR